MLVVEKRGKDGDIVADYTRNGARLVALHVPLDGGFLTEDSYNDTRGRLGQLRQNAPVAFRDLELLARRARVGDNTDLPPDRRDVLAAALKECGLNRGGTVLAVLSDLSAHGFSRDYYPGFMQNASGRPFMPDIFNKTARNVENFATQYPNFAEKLRYAASGVDSNVTISPAQAFEDRALGRDFVRALKEHHLIGGESFGSTAISLEVQAVAPEILRNKARAPGRA